MTPTERMAKLQASRGCRLCAWLVWLNISYVEGWREAINDPRFSTSVVLAEVNIEQTNGDYTGDLVGKTTVENHRKQGHA